MLKRKKAMPKAWVVGLLIIFISLVATPVFSKTINLKDIGTIPTLWIIIGVIIVLLQLVPAAILFFSFIGVTSSMVFRWNKAKEEVTSEEKEIVPIVGYGAIPIKNGFESEK